MEASVNRPLARAERQIKADTSAGLAEAAAVEPVGA
jgi:hypothetical protein